MSLPFFTVGHSTRTIGEFIELLAASKIGLVVDVRSIPLSRTNPQYNRETLPISLLDSHIAYEHMAELGGRRSRVQSIAPGVNGFWENQSFHNYADYAMTAGFRSGVARLRELGNVQRCAVMCAEAVCTEKSDPAILVMKAAKDGAWCDGAEVLNCAGKWGIFVKRVMNSRLIIVGDILPKDPAQVRLPEYDHVVETFPSDRADQSLHVPILPRRTRGNGLVADGHGA
jgi:hypothetical protein